MSITFTHSDAKAKSYARTRRSALHYMGAKKSVARLGVLLLTLLIVTSSGAVSPVSRSLGTAANAGLAASAPAYAPASSTTSLLDGLKSSMQSVGQSYGTGRAHAASLTGLSLFSGIVRDVASGMTLYENKEAGVSFQYPSDWPTRTASSSVTLLSVASPDTDMILTAQQFTPGELGIASDASYPVLLDTVKNQFTSGSDGFTADSSTDIQVQGADHASKLEFHGATSRGTPLRVSVDVAQHDDKLLIFTFLGLAEKFNDYSDTMNQVTGSLTVTEPEIYGVPRNEGLFLSSGDSSNPRDYDPANGYGSSLLWSRLVSFDQHLHVVPDLAQSWDVSEDGTIYTFHLRPEARFHDGRTIIADDVIYSWERALSPEINSNNALTYLNDIVGAQDVREGKAKHISGLRKVDDQTVEVRIDAPKPYFLMKITYVVAAVVDKQNVESGVDWYKHPNGSGPYKLTNWEVGKVQVYTRNDDYYLAPPNIKYIVLLLYQGQSLNMYETGDIDVTSVGGVQLERAKDPTGTMYKDLVNGVGMCTHYVLFDVNQAPFDDPKVRQAFAMSIDKNEYLQVSLQGDGLVANGLYPPSLPGHNSGLQGLAFDPVKAKQLLSESKYGSAANLPPIVFTTGGYGNDISPGIAALVDMWQKNLGVSVHMENVDAEVYMDEVHAGHHSQMIQSGWCADYPDPENFADALFHTGATENAGNYSNTQVDALLEKARVEKDVATRLQMYQQAEQMIVSDAPAIFLTNPLVHTLVKPYVKGYVFSPVGVSHERFLSLEH